jgi:hypothetical protein
VPFSCDSFECKEMLKVLIIKSLILLYKTSVYVRTCNKKNTEMIISWLIYAALYKTDVLERTYDIHFRCFILYQASDN